MKERHFSLSWFVPKFFQARKKAVDNLSFLESEVTPEIEIHADIWRQPHAVSFAPVPLRHRADGWRRGSPSLDDYWHVRVSGTL